MPLGDSLTYGEALTPAQGGYRNPLYTLLTTMNYNVDFIGTFSDTDNPTLPDVNHQGLAGARIDQVQPNIGAWLNATEDPDVVLLMLGTNDVWQNYQLATAATRLSNLISDIATKRPYTKIILANLPPRVDNTSLEQLQLTYNAAIPEIVTQQLALGHQVSSVDMHSVLSPFDFSSDGVHPSASGYAKIAAAWSTQITRLFSPQGTSNPPAIVTAESSSDLLHVTLKFSKPLADNASNLTNFSLNGGLSLSNAMLDSATKRLITLTSSTQTPGTRYTIAVSGVRDATPEQNLIATGTSIDFSSSDSSNGSFEQDLTGWTSTGNLAIASAAPYAASHGSKLLAFNAGNSTPNGELTKTFITTAGQTYILAFDAGVLAYNTRSQTMLVTVTGSTNLLSQTLTFDGLGAGTTRWLPQSFTFIANSASTTLTFQDQSSSSSSLDLLLDNVRFSRIASSPNTAPLAIADAYSTDQDTALIVPASGVLANDIDAQSNPLTAILHTGPSHGSLILNTNGSFTYTPTPAYTGSDSFRYFANDGTADSNITTVMLTLNPLVFNDLINGSFELDFTGWTRTGNLAIKSLLPYTANHGNALIAFNSGNSTPNGVLTQTFPTAVGQSYTLAFDAGVLSYNTNPQKLLVTANGTNNLLTQTITINGLSGGTNRWLSQSLNFVANSTATTLTFRDQSTATNALDLLLDNVRITAIANTPNTAPIAITDTYSIAQDTTLEVPATGLLANDTDAQFNPLTAAINTEPSHGNIILNPDGSFSYTPMVNYTGTDSFTYHAKDGNLNSNVAIVSIIIKPFILETLANGSFEQDFTSWTISGNTKIKFTATYTATNGNRLVAFNSGNSTPNGVLSQIFPTTTGQSYLLLFDTGVLSYNTNSQKMLVTATGTGNLLAQTITINGLSNGTNRWLPQSFTFVADSTATNLTFRDNSTTTDALDLLLDNIRVLVQPTILASSVPATNSGIDPNSPPTDLVPLSANFGNPKLTGTKGNFSICMTAMLAGIYILEYSNDLKTWQVLDQKEYQPQESIEFFDTQNLLNPETSLPQRFYRIGHQTKAPPN